MRPTWSVRCAVLLLCLTVPGLSGCLSDAFAQPVEAVEPPIERLLVRAFVEDGVIHVRIGGVTAEPALVPFDGDLEILLVPESTGSWNHRILRSSVDPSMFILEPLPYTELTERAPFLSETDSVRVYAEAVLDDGRAVQGTYRTMVYE